MGTFVRAERIDRFQDAWASGYHDGRVCTRFVSDDEPGFWGELRISDLGPVRVTQLSAAPYRAWRTPALVRRYDPELLYLNMVRHGCGIVGQDSREASLGPTDLVLFDSSHPYRIQTAGHGNTVSGLQLAFPRALLPLPASQIGRLTAVPLRPSAGIGSLAARFLAELAAGIDHYAQTEAVGLSMAVLELLATRLAHELDGDRWIPPEIHRRALMTRIHAFIADNLADPDLTPGTVAAAHHISLRYLHRLFHADGTTVAGWIRRRRLTACRRDLDDPALTGRPVAAIAARWGFASAAHFSRVFKAAYGMPPQEYRRGVAGRAC